MNFARALAAAFFAACLFATGAASAQTYPNRPITMLVPFPPGGATDTIARILQDPMQKSLGQTIVIENVGGAGGMICAARGARAAPDGYTFMIHQVALAAGVSLYPNLAFDAVKDFAPIGLINTAASTLAAPASLPPKNFKELLAWMKTPGHTVRIGHPGVGSYGHLAGVLVAQELGVKVTQVPYRGAGASIQDLVAGQIDVMLDTPAVSGGMVRGGSIKGYAVTAPKRVAAVPDLPTTDEAGLPGFYFSFWHALWAPKGTPKAIVAKLNEAVVNALADPAVRRRLIDLAQDIYPRDQQTPEALLALHKAEIEKWWPIIKAAGIKAE